MRAHWLPARLRGSGGQRTGLACTDPTNTDTLTAATTMATLLRPTLSKGPLTRGASGG